MAAKKGKQSAGKSATTAKRKATKTARANENVVTARATGDDVRPKVVAIMARV